MNDFNNKTFITDPNTMGFALPPDEEEALQHPDAAALPRPPQPTPPAAAAASAPSAVPALAEARTLPVNRTSEPQRSSPTPSAGATAPSLLPHEEPPALKRIRTADLERSGGVAVNASPPAACTAAATAGAAELDSTDMGGQAIPMQIDTAPPAVQPPQQPRGAADVDAIPLSRQPQPQLQRTAPAVVSTSAGYGLPLAGSLSAPQPHLRSLPVQVKRAAVGVHNQHRAAAVSQQQAASVAHSASCSAAGGSSGHVVAATAAAAAAPISRERSAARSDEAEGSMGAAAAAEESVKRRKTVPAPAEEVTDPSPPVQLQQPPAAQPHGGPRLLAPVQAEPAPTAAPVSTAPNRQRGMPAAPAAAGATAATAAGPHFRLLPERIPKRFVDAVKSARDHPSAGWFQARPFTPCSPDSPTHPPTHCTYPPPPSHL